MRQYTTPTETLFIPGHSLEDAQQVFVSFSDKCRKHVLTVSDNITIEDSEAGATLFVNLTQEQTAMFKPKESVDIQVNWIASTGARIATEIVPIPCWENLIKEVI